MIPSLDQYKRMEESLFGIQGNVKDVEEAVKPALEALSQLNAQYQVALKTIEAEVETAVKKYTTPDETGKTYLDHISESYKALLEFESSVKDALDKRESESDYLLIKLYLKGLIEPLKTFYEQRLEEYEKASKIYRYIVEKRYREALKPVEQGDETSRKIEEMMEAQETIEEEIQGKLPN